MTVRQSLLAILDQGPCYGYQLRAEFARRTGGSWPLNVGQIYNTLDRLERDGLAEKGDTDEQGHVYWRITDAGSADVRRWLASPVDRGATTRDELAVKLAVAATLPGVEMAEVIRTQRAASAARLQSLRTRGAGAEPQKGGAAANRGSGAEPQQGGAAANPEDLARSLVLDAMVFSAEAEVRWLDHAAARIARHPVHALELSDERPKRGRPARVGASAA
jgi:DNA-binding PadR family transcriptional regulator